MKNIHLLLFCLAVIVNAQAQSFSSDVIGSAGTFATSTSGSMAWTIGEVATESYSSFTNFFTQGFQQPDASFVIKTSDNAKQNVSIYPNPVIDHVVIDFNASGGNHRVELFDMKGQLLRKEVVSMDQKQVSISFLEFANGVYLLNIINKESNTRNSYKINKAE